MPMSRSTRVLAPVVLVLLLVAGAALARCDWEPRTAAHLVSSGAAPRELAPGPVTTTTSPAPPPTTAAPAPPVPATVAPRPPQAAPRPVSAAVAPEPPSVIDDAFWARLGPGCESSTGTGGNGGGYFQFSPDTAKRVGYHAGLSYEAQRGLAKQWLATIGVAAGGSRSGWPHCWWVAKRG